MEEDIQGMLYAENINSYRFSAFWLRSCETSVLFSVITETLFTEQPVYQAVFGFGPWKMGLASSRPRVGSVLQYIRDSAHSLRGILKIQKQD